MATKTNQVFIQVGDEVIELKGVELEALLQTQKEMQDEIALEKAKAEAKAQAKAVAEGKLAALGLTTDDLRALGL